MGNLESQIGEAEFNGRANKELLKILTRKAMWWKGSSRNRGLAIVPDV